MINKKLEMELKKDLLKSGFGAEMKALKIFSEENWSTTGLYSYMDWDEKKSRESDIYAHITKFEKKDNNITAQSFFSIVAEVKKSQKPWIIFKEKASNEWNKGEWWNSIVYASGIDVHVEITNALSYKTLSFEYGWYGIGIHEHLNHLMINLGGILHLYQFAKLVNII